MQGDSLNGATGLGFGSTDGNVGAAVVYNDVGSFAIGELQFYTKETTSQAADPVRRMTIHKDGEISVTGSLKIGPLALDPDANAAATHPLTVHGDISGSGKIFNVGGIETQGSLGVTGSINVSGSIYPSHVSAGTSDLGSPSNKWANIYTSDLHLKNERGDWTIIEEENDLTVRNNKTNKMYRFKLEEIED